MRLRATLIAAVLGVACTPVFSGDSISRLELLRAQAVARWSAATGLDVGGLTAGCSVRWGLDECRDPSHWACTVSGPDVCRIWVSPMIPGERIADTVSHEFGHALGADHVGAGNGLMAPSHGRCISAADINEVCKRRHCPDWNEEC